MNTRAPGRHFLQIPGPTDVPGRVLRALADPTVTVVAQHAPAVSVSIAEEFGLPAGTDVDGQMVAALRRVGFDRVFDTSFTADLTIMEEGSELAHRLANGGALPMMILLLGD